MCALENGIVGNGKRRREIDRRLRAAAVDGREDGVPLGRHDGRELWEVQNVNRVTIGGELWVPGNLEANLVRFRTSLQVPGTGVWRSWRYA